MKYRSKKQILIEKEREVLKAMEKLIALGESIKRQLKEIRRRRGEI